MESRTIDNLTQRNMDYLKSNMEDITLLEKGRIFIGSIDARWFTYTKKQNGVIRDMINYIIPVKGFAYMITFGTNQGSIHKYRPDFNKMAKSFRTTNG